MKAVFLDRDGVINELVYYREAGVIDSPFTVAQFHLLPGVGQAIRRLNQADYKVVVVSNQPGIAKNHFTPDTLHRMDEKLKTALAEERAHLDAIYYCYHHPEGENPRYNIVCQCRKPEPGLLLQAGENFKLDFEKCYMVGDNLTDVQTGQRVGCKTILIGKTKCEMCHLMDEQGIKPDAIVSSLTAAVTNILNWEESHGDIHRFC
ncbi:MAG: HAD family hydrolase [Chloroflexi bacterium]|nr:HAD family hydrolase [Chloroflexota bacterium]